MRDAVVVWCVVALVACSSVDPLPPVDGGAVADSGPTTDAGQPATDAGQPATDAGQPAADAGQPAADAGLPAADAGPPGCATATFFLDTRAWDQQPQRVRLAGSFNEWSSETHPLSLGADGLWTLDVALEAGAYAYKLVVDERWIVDPHGSRYLDDGEHNTNSLYEHNCWPRADAFYVLSNRANDGVHSVSVQLPGAGDAEVSLDGQARVQGVSREGRSMQVVVAGLSPGVHDLTVRFGGGMRRVKLIQGSSAAWSDRSMYFVMLDRFANGDPGNDGPIAGVPAATNYRGGDLAGLLTSIEAGYFNELGLDTLWLSWPMAGPGRAMAGSRLDAEGCGLNPYDENIARQDTQYSGFHGYWPTDFQVVDPRFGSSTDLHAVVAAAHARGLRIVLDLPANHVHEDHPIFADRADDSWFNFPAQRCGWDVPWDEAPETCWFTSYLPDLNLAHPGARGWLVEQALRVAETYGIDGFRLDALKHLDPKFLRDLAQALRVRMEAGSPVKFYTVGETFSGDEQQITPFLGSDGVRAQFDFPTNMSILQGFALSQTGLGAMDARVRQVKGSYASSSMVTFVGNHDIGRFTSLANGDLCGAWDMASNQAIGWRSPPAAPVDDAAYARLRLALAYAFTLPGLPMVYYGDEIGLAGGGDPDNRRMMRFAELSASEAATRSFVSRLGTLRQQQAALRQGAWPGLAWQDDNTLAYVRTHADGDVLVILNRGAARSIDLNLVEVGLHGGLVEAFGGAERLFVGGQANRFELPALSVQVWVRR
jgi:glycosidase